MDPHDIRVLTKSAQLIKCPSSASFLARMFARIPSTMQTPNLARVLEVAEWKGGDHELESVVFEEADTITATGSDATLQEIHQRVPHDKTLLSYGHKVSGAWITKGALEGLGTQASAQGCR